MKSKLFVQWCVSTQFVGANGYKGKKGLTEEGGSQIIFVVKLKKTEKQLEPAAGFGENCSVGLAHEGLGWRGIVLAEGSLGSTFTKVFPASVVQPCVL